MEMHLPEAASRRFLRLPQSAEEGTWVCPVCGVMAPKRLIFKGSVRYVPTRCACQLAQQERQAQEEYRREWLSWQTFRLYNWLGKSWSDEPLRSRTFDNFDPGKQPEAFGAVKLFAATQTGTLVLYGSYGTGKTHLLAALCNDVLSQKPPVPGLFTTAPKLFGAIQERLSTKEDHRRLIDSAIATPLLVIDDIDKARYSEFREEIYFEIVDERVKARRPIALSTNRLADLARYVGGAVCSRLKVGQIAVEMVGNDYREEL
jgi:DNA replication protein DnaC